MKTLHAYGFLFSLALLFLLHSSSIATETELSWRDISLSQTTEKEVWKIFGEPYVVMLPSKSYIDLRKGEKPLRVIYKHWKPIVKQHADAKDPEFLRKIPLLVPDEMYLVEAHFFSKTSY